MTETYSEGPELEKVRRHWEGDMPEVAMMFDQNQQRCLVVVKDEGDVDDPYRCHRYFKMGFGDNVKWVCSVDGDRCHHETVMRWFCNPAAATCRSTD